MRVLKVTNMYPTDDRPNFGVFVSQETESLRRLGVDVDVLFVDGQANRLNYIAAYPRFWKRLLQNEYDLIHAHYVFAGLIALAQRGNPLVVTHHGAEVFESWEAPLCRLFTRWFDSVIVRTEEMWTKLGVKEAHVIPGGIDLERFSPQPQEACRARLGLPAGRKLVLWAGVDRPDKRYQLAVEAMERLSPAYRDAMLVKLSGRPHELVPIYMNACDMLLLTSESEGSPNVVKEAMACNLPVVGTSVGDVPQLIGATEGCYVTGHKAADIARKIERALAFGRRTDGREAVAYLAMDRISERIIDVYEQTLAAAGRRDVERTPSPAR